MGIQIEFLLFNPSQGSGIINNALEMWKSVDRSFLISSSFLILDAHVEYVAAGFKSNKVCIRLDTDLEEKRDLE